MTEEEFDAGVDAVKAIYSGSRVLASDGATRPLRIAPIPIPDVFWCGGTTRLLVVFNLDTHDSDRPRGLLGDEWRLPGGNAPHNADVVFEFGEAWQAYSWSFPWPPALGVMQTVEAYLGRFDDHR